MAIPSFTFLLLIFISFIHVSDQAYATTGVPTGVQWSGERPFRTEINDFAKSGPAFDLYILSLQKMQQTNESDMLSYFQIAGIHGFPTVTWNGAPGNPDWGWGYCHHDSDLFPSWHRPYVALFEQVVWENAQAIAKTYPDSQRSEYVDAASSLRIPYWDWALNPSMPDVTTSPQISVNTPTGNQKISNPLFNYTFQSRPVDHGFPSSDPDGTPPFTQYMSTVRWPDSNNQSQNDLATTSLQQNAAFLVSTLYQVFSAGPNFTQISTTAVSDVSIEYLHDAVHYFVGGDSGHMDYLQWAGFDPIFWLHHTNVDRIFAIWQAIYPDDYVKPWKGSGTYAIAPGSTLSNETALSPFYYNDDGLFHNSETVRWDRWLGYAYPEVLDWTVNATELSKAVRAKVNQLYSPINKKSKRLASDTKALVNRGTAGTLGHVGIDLYNELDVNNLGEQWVAHLKVNKYSLNSSFNIDVFSGSPPAKQSDWALAPNLIGTFPVLSSAGIAPSSHMAQGVPKFGQIPLTATLAAAVSQGVIQNLEPSSVTPLLKKSLQVHARARQGATMGDLTGFSITILSRNVIPAATESDFPIYGQWTEYPDITPRIQS